MDVMAFGWIVFEIANDMVPYWQTQECGIVQPATDEKILDALANLTDERIATTLESVFPATPFVFTGCAAGQSTSSIHG